MSQNGYSYVNGNPVRNVDPNGMVALRLPGIVQIAGALWAAVVTAATLSYLQMLTVKDLLLDIYRVMLVKYKSIKKIPVYKTKWEVHHIVAQTSPFAKYSRSVLKKYGLKVKADKRNLVALKTGFHRRLHTKVYYEGVNEILKKVSGKRNSTLSALSALKRGLLVIDKLLPF